MATEYTCVVSVQSTVKISRMGISTVGGQKKVDRSAKQKPQQCKRVFCRYVNEALLMCLCVSVYTHSDKVDSTHRRTPIFSLQTFWRE